LFLGDAHVSMSDLKTSLVLRFCKAIETRMSTGGC